MLPGPLVAQIPVTANGRTVAGSLLLWGQLYKVTDMKKGFREKPQ